MRIRKIIRVFVKSLFGILVFYWIGLNFLLVGRFFPWLVSEGQGHSFNLDHSFAFSILPGHIEIYNLRLNGEDPNVRWRVQVKWMHAKFALHRLIKREAHASFVRAKGIQVEFILKDKSKNPPLAAKPSPEMMTKKKSEGKGPWTIVLKDVKLYDVERVNFESVHFEGSSDIFGAMILHPGEQLELPPGAWTIRDGRLQRDDILILDRINGKAAVAVSPVDLRKGSVLDAMNINIDFDSRIFDAQFFGALLKGYRPLVFGKTFGHIYSKIDIKNGIFQNDSYLNASVKKINLVFTGAQLTARGNINFAVDHSAAVTKLDFTDINWWGNTHLKKEQLLAYAPSLKIHTISHDLELKKLFSDIRIFADIPNAKIKRLDKVFEHFTQGPVSQTFLAKDGSFDLHAWAQPQNSRAKVSVRFKAPRLQVKLSEAKLETKIDTKITLKSKDYDNGNFYLSNSEINLTDPTVLDAKAIEKFHTKQWDASLTVYRANLHLKDRFKLDGFFKLNLDNFKLPARFARPDSKIIPIALFLVPMRHFQAQGRLHMDDKTTEVSHFFGQGSSGTIRGHALFTAQESQFKILANLWLLSICAQKEGEKMHISFGDDKTNCLADAHIPLRSTLIY